MNKIPRRWRGVMLFAAGLVLAIAVIALGLGPVAGAVPLGMMLFGSRMMNDYAFGRTDE